MNTFEQLCKLASEENWCWKLECSTCATMHFRCAFFELAKGKSPKNSSWDVYFSEQLPSEYEFMPWEYAENEKKALHEICVTSNLARIAASCKFPDWLGYLGLVLEFTKSDSSEYRELSKVWASQLSELMPKTSDIKNLLGEISRGEGDLTVAELEQCEEALSVS